MFSVPPDVVALSLVPALLWGLSPVLSKRGMEAGGSALQAALVVVAVDAALFWTALLALTGAGWNAGLSGRAVGLFVVGGVVGTALGRIGAFEGVRRVGASVNSAGVSARPLFSAGLAVVLLSEPLGPITVAGIVVLVAGLVVLALSKGGDVRGWATAELLFPLLAAAAFGFGSVVRRGALTTTAAGPLAGVAVNEVAALAALGTYAVLRGRESRGAVLGAPRRSYAYFVGSGVLTAVALLSLFAALDRGRVAVVDPLSSTAPLFTPAFAYLVLGDVERVTRGVVAGAALVVVGAVLITAA